jgi:uncharacterized membrane protein YphA (DoxX/SURF4 family)
MRLLDPAVGDLLSLVARLCLSLFFLPSAIGKIRHHHRFVAGIIEYQIVPERIARFIGTTLPWLELSLVLALLLDVARPLTGAVISILLLSFIAAITINLHRGREIPCHCYGMADTDIVSWGMVGRNLLLLFLTIGMATLPSQASIEVWREPPWDAAMRSVFVSSTTGTVLLLLLVSCYVSILLSEWTIALHIRLSRLADR